MVSVSGFLRDADTLFNEIQKREKEAEKCRLMEFMAVRNIQRWVRGFLERRHIARLHEAALMIQKNWRGYRGRKIYFKLLKDTLEKMFRDYYNGMATRIQRLWRGYVVRLYVYDHRIFRQWMAMVLMKNKEKRFDNKNFEETLKDANEYEAEMKAKEHVLFILFKVHHLLRTYGVPGICSILDSKQLSVIEQQLEELNLLDYTESLHRKREEVRLAYGTAAPVNLPNDVWHRKCEEFWFKRIRVGKPPIFAEGKYVEYAYIQEAITQQAAMAPHRMLFSPIKYNDQPSIINKEPYTETPILPLREQRPSRFIKPPGFIVSGKYDEASATYQPFKYGPYRHEISKTDLFIQKHQEECLGKRKQNGK